MTESQAKVEFLPVRVVAVIGTDMVFGTSGVTLAQWREVLAGDGLVRVEGETWSVDPGGYLCLEGAGAESGNYRFCYDYDAQSWSIEPVEGELPLLPKLLLRVKDGDYRKYETEADEQAIRKVVERGDDPWNADKPDSYNDGFNVERGERFYLPNGDVYEVVFSSETPSKLTIAAFVEIAPETLGLAAKAE